LHYCKVKTESIDRDGSQLCASVRLARSLRHSAPGATKTNGGDNSISVSV